MPMMPAYSMSEYWNRIDKTVRNVADGFKYQSVIRPGRPYDNIERVYHVEHRPRDEPYVLRLKNFKYSVNDYGHPVGHEDRSPLTVEMCPPSALKERILSVVGKEAKPKVTIYLNRAFPHADSKALAHQLKEALGTEGFGTSLSRAER